MKEELSVSNLYGHLEKGVNPIVVCIGSFNDFDELSAEHPESLENLKDVNWVKGAYESEKRKDFLTNGPRTYIISSIDGSNKFSKELSFCTGLIVAGIDKITGKNISFVTHQPNVSRLSVSFISDLKRRCIEMKERCILNTIDARIVGGIDPSDSKTSQPEKNYASTIQLLSDEMYQVFGFKPIIINGPKDYREGNNHDNIYYDNENRRLYLIRPEVNINQ